MEREEKIRHQKEDREFPKRNRNCAGRNASNSFAGSEIENSARGNSSAGKGKNSCAARS